MNQVRKSPLRNIMASRLARLEYNLVDNFDIFKEECISEPRKCRKGRVSEANMDETDLLVI